jgi:hypothetical protein
MKNSKCIYTKALYYATIYALLVFIGFILSVVNNVLGWNFEVLNVLGFGALIVPTVPFQGLLFSQNMMITNGEWIMPTDAGIFLSHAIWFILFYVVYFVYLKWKNCICKKKST